MPLPGYAGSILYVDLTTSIIREEPLSPELIDSFVGGYGINNWLAYHLIPPQIDPLSPGNALILGTGPFCGTFIPGAAKILATTKFPLNGAFATAAAGASFSLFLKSAGYDHVVVTGKSPYPVFLQIAQDDIELHDATSLWGQDTFVTTNKLRARFEPCSVIPIGPAGENLVKCSITSVDKMGTLGRGGLPAVMGSKNLKAIVVLQGSTKVKVAHPSPFHKMVEELHQRMMRWPGRQPLLDKGMSFVGEGSLASAPPGVLEIHRQSKQLLACPSCLLADKCRVKLKEGSAAGLTTYMTHLWMERFGEGKEQEIYERAVVYEDALNRYGLCHMTFTYLFFLICQLYQEGVITRDNTGGVEIKPDLETALALARLTAHRQGFGKLLAEGPAKAMQQIDRGAESRLEHIKGQSIVIDPRLSGLGTMEFEQIVNPRGAHVASGGSPSYEPGRPPGDFARHGERMGASPQAIQRAAGSGTINPARFTRFSEDWYALFSCLGLCNRAFVNRFYHINTLSQLYSALTGRETSSAQLMKAAGRAWDLGKFLNVRAGFTRKDDQAPHAWFSPREQAGEKYQLTDYYKTRLLSPADLAKLLDDYYDERGYDPDTGAPRPETIAQMGLE